MATSTTNQVLTGFDVKIMIGEEQIGRGQSFTASVKQNIEVIYEQGTRKGVEIKEKKFEVSGTLKRWNISNFLVQKAVGGTSYTDTEPYFTIKAYMKNPADGSKRGITFQFVKFENWDIDMPLEGEVGETLNWKALDVIIE